jgi:hypothetical protein
VSVTTGRACRAVTVFHSICPLAHAAAVDQAWQADEYNARFAPPEPVSATSGTPARSSPSHRRRSGSAERVDGVAVVKAGSLIRRPPRSRSRATRAASSAAASARAARSSSTARFRSSSVARADATDSQRRRRGSRRRPKPPSPRRRATRSRNRQTPSGGPSYGGRARPGSALPRSIATIRSASGARNRPRPASRRFHQSRSQLSSASVTAGALDDERLLWPVIPGTSRLWPVAPCGLSRRRSRVRVRSLESKIALQISIMCCLSRHCTIRTTQRAFEAAETAKRQSEGPSGTTISTQARRQPSSDRECRCK